MALFFDRPWFDRKLAALGLSRADMAASGGISLDDLTLVFKDQMEVSPDQVQIWAHLLHESVVEIATRSGVTTPFAPSKSDADRMAKLEARVSVLEVQIADMLRQLSVKS